MSVPEKQKTPEEKQQLPETIKPQKAIVKARPIPVGGFMVPTTLEEAWRCASVLADSQIVPKDMQGRPADIMVAMQMGLEVGLSVMQAVQSIAVINGRPSLWGDAVLGLVKHHPDYEWIKETFDEKTMSAVCEVKRKGECSVRQVFSKADAEKAELWTKKGTWQTYPKRMLQMRARSWAIRDAFPDAMKGLGMVEENVDIREVVVKTVDPVTADVGAQPKGPDTFQRATSGMPEEVLVKSDKEESEEPVEAYNRLEQENGREPELLQSAIEKIGLKSFEEVDPLNCGMCNKLYGTYLNMFEAREKLAKK